MRGIIIKDTDNILSLDKLVAVDIGESISDVNKLPESVTRVIESVTSKYQKISIENTDYSIIAQAPSEDTAESLLQLAQDSRFINSKKLNYVATYLVKSRDVIGDAILINEKGDASLDELINIIVPMKNIKYEADKTQFIPPRELDNPKTKEDRARILEMTLDYLTTNKYISNDLAKLFRHYATQRYVEKKYNFEMNVDVANFDGKPQYIHFALNRGAVPSPEEIRYREQKIKNYNKNRSRENDKSRLKMLKNGEVVKYRN